MASTSSSAPETTTARGPLTAAIETSVGRAAAPTSSSVASSDTIAPPAGSACISRPRAATSAHASSSDQHARDVRGGDLADRVPEQDVGRDAPRLQQPEQRDLEGEQRGLGVPRLVAGLAAVAHRVARPGDVEARADLSKASANTGNRALSSAPMPSALRALAGEDERRRAGRAVVGHDHAGRGAAGGEAAQPLDQLVAVRAEHDRAVREPGRGPGERPRHVR